MKTTKVVPALVAVLMLVGWLMPAPPAHSNPLIWMGLYELASGLLQDRTQKPMSEVGKECSAALSVDGRVVAGTFVPENVGMVILKKADHAIELILASSWNAAPHAVTDFTEARVWCDTTLVLKMSEEDAARAAGSEPVRESAVIARPERTTFAGQWIMRNRPQRSCDRQNELRDIEKDWKVRININELSFGPHLVRVDYFFRNGGRKDSYSVFLHVFVTDEQSLQEGINDGTIQQVLSNGAGMWSPIPALVPTSIPVTPEMARMNGLEQRAIAAGVPRDGSIELTTREVGQVYGSIQTSSPPPNGYEQLCADVAYSGGGPIYRTTRRLESVPLVICVSGNQRVVVNGRPEQGTLPGYIVLTTQPGQELNIDVNGRALYRGVAPPMGFGLWLTAQ